MNLELKKKEAMERRFKRDWLSCCSVYLSIHVCVDWQHRHISRFKVSEDIVKVKRVWGRLLLYMKNWATRLANPRTIKKLWKTADGQRSKPCLFREIMCTNAGKINTKARPQVAPENLHRKDTLLISQHNIYLKKVGAYTR